MKAISPKLKRLLYRIDTVLAEASDDSIKLWDILTALRGPDALGSLTKNATTAVIRATAFPRTYNSKQEGEPFGGAILATFKKDQSGNVAIRQGIDGGHFRSHAKYAFHALGLDWDKVNG